MSAGSSLLQNLIGQAVSSSVDSIGSLLNIIPRGSLDDIEIQATIEESFSDTLEVTAHPVEQGAEVTDHSYGRMPEIVIRCGWSNSVAAGLQGALTTAVSTVSSVAARFSGGQTNVTDYAGSVYSKLLSLQQSGKPFDVVTSIRQYSNMLMTQLHVTRDQKTSQALMVSATCKQARIVKTSSAKLPALTNQASPSDTAETISVGAQSFGTPIGGFR